MRAVRIIASELRVGDVIVLGRSPSLRTITHIGKRNAGEVVLSTHVDGERDRFDVVRGGRTVWMTIP